MKLRFLFPVVLLLLAIPVFGETLIINQGSLNQSWLKVAGTGLIEFTEEGFLVSEKGSQYIEIRYDFSDFELSFDVKVTEYGTYGNVYLSLHEQDNFMGHTITFDAARTQVMTRHGYWSDYTWVSGMNPGVKVGSWHNIKVVCRDERFTVFINGDKIGEFMDADGLYPTGSIVIKAANSVMELKNIQVNADKLEPKSIPTIVFETDRKPNPNARISGTFLDLDYSNVRWDPGSWAEEFESMKKLGMDLIVIRPYIKDMEAPPYFVLDEIFLEANKQGFKIMLGSYSNKNYQWTNLSKAVLKESMDKIKADLDELYRRYGDNPAFYGWYIADEIDEKDFVGNRFKTATSYYSEQVEYMKSLTPDKPILVCPSYDANSTSASWWAKKYDEFLNIVKVDIIGPQDSVGAKRATPEQAAVIFGGFKEATDKHNVTLWADVEIFDYHTWQPAPIELLKKQLLAVEPHVEKVIVFEFNHYMNPLKNAKTRTLYEDYREWIE